MYTNLSKAYIAVAILLSAFLLAPAVVSADTSNKWRIEVDGGADSDGEMIFHVTPEDLQTTEVRVSIEDGTGENRVARTIRDAFKKQLPGDNFHIEVDDGEDVLVKKRGGAPDFALTLESSTVRHTEIEIEKE